MLRKSLALFTFSLLAAATAFAQADERFDARAGGVDVPTQSRGVGVSPGDLFAGTALNGPGGNNDVFLIDPTSGAAAAFLSGVPIWGATYDAANARILYTTEAGTDSTTDGAPLYEIAVGSGTPSLVGVITDGATDFRIDGLAVSGGVLYGSRAAASADGIYSIDLGTMVATLELGTTDSISGIDADPDTGTIYGVNDSTASLVEIDIAGATITPVAAYPDPGEGDLDGLAVGNGRAYLVPDDNAPGLIYVYDFASGTFDTPIPAPWGATADTFSGAALVTMAAPPVTEIPTAGTVGLIALGLLLGLGALFTLRRLA